MSLFQYFQENFAYLECTNLRKKIVCGRHIAHPCRGSHHVTMPSM